VKTQEKIIHDPFFPASSVKASPFLLAWVVIRYQLSDVMAMNRPSHKQVDSWSYLDTGNLVQPRGWSLCKVSSFLKFQAWAFAVLCNPSWFLIVFKFRNLELKLTVSAQYGRTRQMIHSALHCKGVILILVWTNRLVQAANVMYEIDVFYQMNSSRLVVYSSFRYHVCLNIYT